MTEPNRTILYFCYGRQEIYDQAIYSILSLLHVDPAPRPTYRIVVYCDRPDLLAGLPVETVPIDPSTLDRWLDDGDYIHRRKTCAIIDALDRFGGKVVFVDTDTYFRRSPAPLFARVGPGRVCFHLCEGCVLSTGTPSDQALARQLATGTVRAPSGDIVEITRRTLMWNTGVVGIDASDRATLQEALRLSDTIWEGADPAGAYGRKIHHAEQFAMGYAFRDFRIGEAVDCVYHYWPAAAKERFGGLLPDLVRSGLGDRSAANLARLYALRYREQGVDAAKDSLKMRLRRTALALGLPVRGVRRSVA